MALPSASASSAIADDEGGGIPGPQLVEAHEALDDRGVLGGAAAGDDEAPGLHVVGGRRPARGLERARELLLVEGRGGVVGAGAPAAGEHLHHGVVGGGGAVEYCGAHGVLLGISERDAGRRRPTGGQQYSRACIPP